MFAVRLHSYGGPEVLTLEDVEMPRPGPGQILIAVGTASVNFADLVRRRNDPYPFPTPLPFTPGGEVAGTVHELGEGVEGPPVGTPVFAVLGDDGSSGYAQYALTFAEQVIPIPPGITEDQASILSVAGATAMLILRQAGRFAAGESVLVPGAAGGVGSYATQIARALGAGTIIGLASTPDKRAASRALGADHVLDPADRGWPEQVRELTGGRGVDLALEMVGGERFTQTLGCLAPFGRLVVFGLAGGIQPTFDASTVGRVFYDPAPNQEVIAFNVGQWFALRPESAQQAIGELIGLVASGAVEVPIAAALALDQAAEAHRMLEERRVAGKIVLKPSLSGS